MIIIKKYLKEKKYIAYHGSGVDFNKFDIRYSGSSKNETVFGEGLYFTSNKEMAKDFAFKGKIPILYTVEFFLKNPYVISSKEIYTKLFEFLENEKANEYDFWDNLFNKYDALVITNRNFGGGMKFPNEYHNFIEYVIRDTSLIHIINKEYL